MKVATNNSLLQFIKLVKSALNGKASSAHTHSVATTSANGFMSSTDKSKLDGIASGANKYSLPTATSSVLGGVKVGSNIKIDCYQDNDTKINFKNMRNELKPYIVNNDNFSVLYNTMGKDFGVPSDKILIDRLKL